MHTNPAPHSQFPTPAKRRGQPSIGDRNVNDFLPPCGATTRHGKPCQFPAHHGTGLCINHDPDYREQQRRNVRKGADNSRKARSAPPLKFDNLDLTDRASIQALIEATIALELAGKLPSARARNVIRLLSLASRNLQKSEYGWVTLSEQRHALRYHLARHHLTPQLNALTNTAQDDPE